MDARNRSLGQWFTRVRTGQVQLPGFQRFEAWGRREVRDLAQTVVDELPAGAVLVLEVGDRPPFRHRPLKGAPEPSERMTELLLDGQQRLTALWRALSDDYPDGRPFGTVSRLSKLRTHSAGMPSARPTRTSVGMPRAVRVAGATRTA